jgi:hypothetical protein
MSFAQCRGAFPSELKWSFLKKYEKNIFQNVFTKLAQRANFKEKFLSKLVKFSFF